MAEYISNEEVKKEEETSLLNFSTIWSIVVLNWQWILFSVFVALAIAVCYLRYTSPVYRSTMKVLIKDEDNKRRFTSNQLMSVENMGLLSNSAGFDNELEILSSANINTRVVRSLKLYVSYYMEGRVKKVELYKNNPIIVDMPQNQLNVLQTPIRLVVTKKDKGLHVEGKIRMPKSDEEITFSRDVEKLPGVITSSMGTIIFQQNPGVKLDDNMKMHAVIIPIETAGRAYSRKMDAAATSKTTTVAQVTFTDTQVERSLDYLNELFKSYNDDANEDKNEVARKTEDFIKSRIELIKDELDVTENELEQYKKTNELINLTNDATTALNKTTEYQKEQVELETQLNLINALVNYMSNPANTTQVIPANLGLSDNGLNTLIGKYNDMVLQRNRLLKSSSEDNPYVQRITNAMEEMWPSIRMSLDAIKSDILTQKRSADDQFNKFNSKITNTPTQERALTNFSRQQEIKANLYLTLLQKREENYISLASTAAKARIIDTPQYMGKVSPKSSIVMLVALVLGFCFPIGIALLKDLLRFHIEGREDIEKLTKLPILADIPLNKKGDGEQALVVHENSNSSMEESFRGLRTSLRFTLGSSEKVIGCTSCIPGEGKTFVSTNLAMSLALLGKKTIIIGLDIRKPRLVKLFDLPASKKGITTFLSDDNGDFELLDEQITHGVMNENLDVLPAGVIPPNPGELVSRVQLENAINILKEHYDYIVVDTPPVGLVSDTLSISRVTDMTLVVTRADYSLRSNFGLINSLANENKLPKVNLVLNGVDLSKKKYGYYYGYGKYGKYGRYGYGKYGYGKYGHYGIYGHYGNDKGEGHTEK